MKILVQCILALLTIVSLNAYAQISSLDDPVYGSGSITYDSGTGIEWLDLTLTTNLSRYDIDQLIGNGNYLDGFRHATTQEVNTLFDNAGIVSNSPNFLGDATTVFDAVLSLISLLGPTSYDQGYPEALGITGEGRMGGLDFYTFNGEPRYGVGISETGGLSYGYNTKYPTVGNWVVRDSLSAVPVPSAVILFSSALLVLLCVVRKGPYVPAGLRVRKFAE